MLLKPLVAGLLALAGLGSWSAALAPARAATRQGAPVVLCVLSPRVEPIDEADAFGEVPTAFPTLLVVEPLQQVRVETGQGRLLWSRQAAAGRALALPLFWPLPPLQPGQRVLLRLQPLGAAADAFAHVRLQAAGPTRMAATATLMQTLGRRVDAWMAAINRALEDGDVPLAWALLYARQAPVAEPLQSLRRQVLQRGCGDSPPMSKGPTPSVPGLGEHKSSEIDLKTGLQNGDAKAGQA